MFHRRLDLLDDYEVVGQPIVTRARLSYRPWIDGAVRPYRVTRLPHCTVHGLREALLRHDVDPEIDLRVQ